MVFPGRRHKLATKCWQPLPRFSVIFSPSFPLLHLLVFYSFVSLYDVFLYMMLYVFFLLLPSWFGLSPVFLVYFIFITSFSFFLPYCFLFTSLYACICSLLLVYLNRTFPSRLWLASFYIYISFLLVFLFFFIFLSMGYVLFSLHFDMFRIIFHNIYSFYSLFCS